MLRVFGPYSFSEAHSYRILLPSKGSLGARSSKAYLEVLHPHLASGRAVRGCWAELEEDALLLSLCGHSSSASISFEETMMAARHTNRRIYQGSLLVLESLELHHLEPVACLLRIQGPPELPPPYGRLPRLRLFFRVRCCGHQ
jgi:hypothetical protein